MKLKLAGPRELDWLSSIKAVCRGSGSSRADRFIELYLRAAQAYMLISMPTGTSTIFGAFQAIRESSQLRWLPWSMSWRDCAELKGRTGSNLTQVATLPPEIRRGGALILKFFGASNRQPDFLRLSQQVQQGLTRL